MSVGGLPMDINIDVESVYAQDEEIQSLDDIVDTMDENDMPNYPVNGY